MMNWEVSLWTFFSTSFSVQRWEPLREMEQRYRRTYYYYYYYHFYTWHGQDQSDLKNYPPPRQTSVLFSNLLKRLSLLRSAPSLNLPASPNNFQSAYKQLHSTETALLKSHNIVLTAMDSGIVAALTLLDLSAAFDTTDYSSLLQRLEQWYGFSSLVISWLKSYLSDQRHSVKYTNSTFRNMKAF